jgi:hypothetical protein
MELRSTKYAVEFSEVLENKLGFSLSMTVWESKNSQWERRLAALCGTHGG